MYIAGVDEVGRGCIAGSVVAAVVVLPNGFVSAEIKDSKKLSAKAREKAYDVIIKNALFYAIGHADAQEIDQINILNATKLAMLRAVDGLGVTPDKLLIDGIHPPLGYDEQNCVCIPGGDDLEISISAASIIAKVTRDYVMRCLHRTYPYYNWQSNVGYPTKEHKSALLTHGISPYHRLSFAPVTRLCASVNF